MLDTDLDYNLLKNDSWGSKSDEISILLNKWLHDISLARLRDPALPCLPDREWRVSLLLLFRDENFKNMTIKSIIQ